MEPPRKTKKGPYGKRALEKEILSKDCEVDGSDDELNLDDVHVQTTEYTDLCNEEALVCVEAASNNIRKKQNISVSLLLNSIS